VRRKITTPEQQPFTWLIPSAINLPRILAKHPPAFSYKIDHFYYLLHVICDKMNFFNPSDKTKWVHLQATKLQDFNDNYKQYLDYLEERNIIIINPSYLKEKYAKGYRISGRYYSGIPVEIPISNNHVLRKKVKKLKQAKAKQLQQADKTHPYLTKWMNSKLVIDKEGALREIDRLYPKNKPTYFHKGKWCSTRRARFKAHRAVIKLHKQEFSYKVDDNIGRYHSDLTCLNKDLRKYLSYFGKRLVSMDIRNSQPLISGILLAKAFYEPGETFNIHSIPSINSLIKHKSRSLSSILSSAYYIMLGESAESPARREFKQYLELVQSGKFYEEMHKLLYPEESFDRARMKETMFIIFFADNRHGPKLRKLEAPFRAKFPNVYNIFRALKRQNKRILSHILQRTESKLMIETVARRIGEEHPDMPIFPVHDSIATYPEHADYVEGVIMEEMKKLTGLNARIGREHWS
jgi:hypothetical protein